MGECKAGEKHREIFEIFHEIFHEIFQAKKFPEILHHYQLSTLCSPRRLLFLPPQICSERNYVTSKPETENRFWPFPKPKNRFYKRNPVLETLTPSGTRRQKIHISRREADCFLLTYTTQTPVLLYGPA